MLALLVLGIGQTFTATTTITLLQTRVPDHMRGRVMSLNTLLMMVHPSTRRFSCRGFDSVIGPPATVLLSAGLVGVYALAALTRPAIRSA